MRARVTSSGTFLGIIKGIKSIIMKEIKNVESKGYKKRRKKEGNQEYEGKKAGQTRKKGEK
jgi:hypothetical protein